MTKENEEFENAGAYSLRSNVIGKRLGVSLSEEAKKRYELQKQEREKEIKRLEPIYLEKKKFAQIERKKWQEQEHSKVLPSRLDIGEGVIIRQAEIQKLEDYRYKKIDNLYSNLESVLSKVDETRNIEETVQNYKNHVERVINLPMKKIKEERDQELFFTEAEKKIKDKVKKLVIAEEKFEREANQIIWEYKEKSRAYLDYPEYAENCLRDIIDSALGQGDYKIDEFLTRDTAWRALALKDFPGEYISWSEARKIQGARLYYDRDKQPFIRSMDELKNVFGFEKEVIPKSEDKD